MRITECMLDRAMRKAISAGLFPRRATESEMASNREILREILEECMALPTENDEPSFHARAAIKRVRAGGGAARRGTRKPHA